MAAKRKASLFCVLLAILVSSSVFASIERPDTLLQVRQADRYELLETIETASIDTTPSLHRALERAFPPPAPVATLAETRVWGSDFLKPLLRPEVTPLSRALHRASAHLWPGIASDRTVLSPDPLGYRDSSNLYAFCGGDPVNCSDPTGLERSELSDDRKEIERRNAARRKAALEERRRGPGSIYASAPGNPDNFVAGGLYLADSLAFSPFSDERSNYHPLNSNEPTQIARDVAAFREKYWREIFGFDVAVALDSPGKWMKVGGVVLAGFGAFENAHAAAGQYQVLQNEKSLNGEGTHVLTELHRMTGEAESLLDAGQGTTAEALLFKKYQDRWFSFFFRGRAIQAETEQLLAIATKSDSVLAQVRIRSKVGGLVPDFVFNQGGRQLIIDITSPRQPSILKATKYVSTGEEIIAEIYHMGRGVK